VQLLRSLVLGVSLLAATACGSADAGDSTGESDEELVKAPVFVRSDQVHYGRAPANTEDLNELVDLEHLSHPIDRANAVIKWINANPKNEKPIYLGNIHTWVYTSSALFRSDVGILAARIHNQSGKQVLFYFEERNATNGPIRVASEHAAQLRQLTVSAKLLMATYVTGRMSHAEVVADVRHFHDWYHGALGVELRDMLIDVDTSQTTAPFYYGTRGNLAAFNEVIGWTLNAAYAEGFGGFHTMGNSKFANWSNGTAYAADSTYATLDRDWDALVKAHPHQTFSGN
jgi:hypothetical protein